MGDDRQRTLSEALGRGRAELHAVRLEVHAEGDAPAEPPAWLHISPAGPVVTGRDGRQYEITDPEGVIDRTEAELPILVDWDHESMLAGYGFGGSSKAAGWIDRVEYVDADDTDDDRPSPGFWGHVEAWTPEGERDVRELRFRMLSPVIRHEIRESDGDGEAPPPVLLSFEAAALTNRPNLRMVALNAEGAPEGVEAKMDDEQLAELRGILGLDEDADADAILARARELTAEDEPDEPADEGEMESAHAKIRLLERERDSLREQIEAHAAAKRDEERAAAVTLVDAAIEQGRAHADSRDDLLRLATSEREDDRAMFERLTAHRIATPPRGQVTAPGEMAPRGGPRRRHTSRREDIAALNDAQRYQYSNFVRGLGWTHARAMAHITESAARA